MANAYPRESVDFQPVEVTRNGLTITTDVEFCIVPDGQRPETFTPAAMESGQTGVVVSGLSQGTYRIFARVSAGSNTPVIDCGYFYIT